MPVTGSKTFPEYTFKCKDCSIEFSISDSEENLKIAKCTKCGSKNVEMLYISFPTDGPGYHKDNSYAIDPKDPRACSEDACTACSMDCSK